MDACRISVRSGLLRWTVLAHGQNGALRHAEEEPGSQETLVVVHEALERRHEAPAYRQDGDQDLGTANRSVSAGVRCTVSMPHMAFMARVSGSSAAMYGT